MIFFFKIQYKCDEIDFESEGKSFSHLLFSFCEDLDRKNKHVDSLEEKSKILRKRMETVEQRSNLLKERNALVAYKTVLK